LHSAQLPWMKAYSTWPVTGSLRSSPCRWCNVSVKRHSFSRTPSPPLESPTGLTGLNLV
jgi:hypothetical protein